MTTQKKVKINYSKDNKKLNNSKKSNFKKSISKLSGAFMLPISVMAIAGLFLGVGAAIQNNLVTSSTEILLQNIVSAVKNIGQVVFDNMPILFAAAIAISFTSEAGVAVFAAIVGYLIFNVIQDSFIDVTYSAIPKDHIPTDAENGQYISKVRILFGGPGREPSELKYLVTITDGYVTLNTSIFGGICIGSITAWAYNRYHTKKLPSILAFFGGKRFVAFVVIVAMIPLAFIFLLFWPWIGRGLAWFGQNSGKLPIGLDSFVFGFVERALLPFGLHHVFYAPLWWSNAGGDAVQSLQSWIDKHPGIEATSPDIQNLIVYLRIAGPVGDVNIWQYLNSWTQNTVTWTWNGSTHTEAVYQFFDRQVGLRLGRFLQGKYPFMIFGLPAAAAAMIVAAPKENRKVAFAAVGSAALTSMLVGVTEPIEFTFLFLAPLLFWGFHCVMAALSFMLMNIVHAHIGMTFSGGIVDSIIYGILPTAKGTHFWWAYIFGLGFIPIYFFVFLIWIKKADLKTPGRGTAVKLFTKADYKNKKDSAATNLSDREQMIIAGFGGWDNLGNMDNCATRLRYDVKDISKVNDDMLLSAGIKSVVRISDKHIQAIIGLDAEQINSSLKENKGQPINIDINNAKKSAKPAVEKIVHKSGIEAKPLAVKSFASGKIIQLNKLNDPAFSSGALGEGIAIRPSKGVVYSPIDGFIETILPTKHAYGITDDYGNKILIHIGLDTVKLEGKGFEPAVKVGQKVKQGDLICNFDLKIIKDNKLQTDTVMVLLPESTGKVTKITKAETATKATKLFTIEPN